MKSNKRKYNILTEEHVDMELENITSSITKLRVVDDDRLVTLEKENKKLHKKMDKVLDKNIILENEIQELNDIIETQKSKMNEIIGRIESIESIDWSRPEPSDYDEPHTYIS